MSKSHLVIMVVSSLYYYTNFYVTSPNFTALHPSLVMHDVHIKFSVSMQSTIFTTPPPVALLWLFPVDFNGN